ncbi:hypothetical protein Hdeb2414_s0007g00239901 [Helianthus debilis subsp. tardiflorus]
MVWRQPDAILNEPEPSTSQINTHFLEINRECPSRVCPFPEQLLVLLVMSALEFIKSDDTSDVAFGDFQATPSEYDVVKGPEQRFEVSSYVNVPDVKGFKKVVVPNVVRRSNRRLNISGPPFTLKHVDLSDNIGVSMDHGSDKGVDKENELVVAGKKSVGKGVVVRMHEYEEFLKKKDKMKDTKSTLKKENEGLVKKEEALAKRVEELTQKHEVEVGELKKQVEALEASRVQLTDDNKWLIEHGFQQVVTYLLHSAEFNGVLGGVYGKLLEHGRHQGYVAGYIACQSGDP